MHIATVKMQQKVFGQITVCNLYNFGGLAKKGLKPVCDKKQIYKS